MRRAGRQLSAHEQQMELWMSSIFHHFSVVKMSGHEARRRDEISRKRIVNLISKIAGNCVVKKKSH